MKEIKKIIIFISLLFCFLSQAGIGDRYIFQPDKKAVFNKCKAATNRGFLIINKKVPGNSKKIRFYFQEKFGAKAIIIHFHGNAGSACSRVPLAERLNGINVNYVFVEYPGFGKGERKPTQRKTLRNAIKVFDYINSNMNPKNLPIFAHGTSLGTGVVTYLASKRQLKGIILHAPYTSMKDVADHLFKSGGRFVKKYTFMAKDWAPLVTEPALSLHARIDEIIPLRIGEEQRRNFTNVEFIDSIILEEGNHMGIYNNSYYWQSISDFIRRVLLTN